MRTPTGSRWVSDNYITRCHRRLGELQFQLESVGDKMPNWEPAAERGLWALSDPWLSSLARMRKKCCYGQKNFGSIYNSLSPSPTYLSHTTNINPFENKVWEVYFYKEVCPFVYWSSSLLLTMFPLIFVYVLCICIVVLRLYNRICNLSSNSRQGHLHFISCQFLWLGERHESICPFASAMGK